MGLGNVGGAQVSAGLRPICVRPSRRELLEFGEALEVAVDIQVELDDH